MLIRITLFLRLQIKRPGHVRRIPYSLREDIAKFDRFVEKQDYVMNHGFKTGREVSLHMLQLGERISSLAQQKRDLNIEASRYEKRGNAAYANLYRLEAEKKYEQMRDLRKEVRLCKEIILEESEVRRRCMGLREEITVERNELIKQKKRIKIR